MIETETNKYERTEAEDWDEIVIDDVDDSGGRPIEPLEWEGDEEFTVKITDEEVEMLRDTTSTSRSTPSTILTGPQ